MTDVSEVLTTSIIIVIALMMEAVSTSEVPVYLEISMVDRTTGCSIPEDSHFHTRRRENLKSHQLTY
jgi:hypothetical protein